MSSRDYEELYLASVRVPLVLAFFLGLWGLVILILQALQIDFSAVLRKASGTSFRSPVLYLWSEKASEQSFPIFFPKLFPPMYFEQLRISALCHAYYARVR